MGMLHLLHNFQLNFVIGIYSSGGRCICSKCYKIDLFVCRNALLHNIPGSRVTSEFI